MNYVTDIEILPTREYSIGELRLVILLADMGHKKHPQPRRIGMIQKLTGLRIGKVTEIATHPVLHRSRIGALSQQLWVMIELEHQRIAAREGLNHMGSDAPQIG